jgi:zinc finger FYVE domain-containing protein 26
MGIFINSKGDLYILASAEANSPWSHNIRLHMYHIFVCEIAAVHIYAGVAANLAERKKLNQLMELLRNIKGTIDDDDWDQVLGTAINVYAKSRHKERPPNRLIEMLSSSHRHLLSLNCKE